MDKVQWFTFIKVDYESHQVYILTTVAVRTPLRHDFLKHRLFRRRRAGRACDKQFINERTI